MKKLVLVTGSGGFVGNAVLRCAEAEEACAVTPLRRQRAARQIREIRDRHPSAQISIINLAWPSLRNYSASLRQTAQNEGEWTEFRRWTTSLAEAAAAQNVRLFQIGSGIEPYATSDSPTVLEPYLSYARRKDEIWTLVHSILPDMSWRLRLHFLFGQGEASHRFVPSAIRAAQSNAPLTIGTPERRRCWLDVETAARGLLTSAITESPENWDICGDTPISFSDLISLVEEATGGAVRIEAPQNPIADAACSEVQPSATAPFMPPGIGAKDDLSEKLSEYARTFRL